MLGEEGGTKVSSLSSVPGPENAAHLRTARDFPFRLLDKSKFLKNSNCLQSVVFIWLSKNAIIEKQHLFLIDLAM